MAVIKMKEELENANRKLNDSIKQRERFLLSLSHEIRNPLNVVLGNIELLYEESVLPHIKERLKICRICGELLLSLVNNLLDVGKADLNNIEICPTECAVKPLFEKIWFSCEELIKTKGLASRIAGIDRLPPLLSLDQYRITQVILNLIGNAVKFTESGEIKMILSWAELQTSILKEGEIHDLSCVEGFEGDLASFKFMKLKGEADPNLLHRNSTNLSQTFVDERHGILEIKIIDTGAGIPADRIHQIFEKQSEKLNPENGRLRIGLGLWISKIICEKMNGNISISSQVGHGTTFTISIKTKTCPLQPKLVPSLASNLENQDVEKFRVMVVDDVPFNADIIQKFISSCNNFEVIKIAENGKIAVDYYEECIKNNTLIHMITMDLEMPVMGGKEACKRIRDLEQRYKIPKSYIVIVSGNCLDSEVSECLKEDGVIKAQKFMRKPLRKEEFTSLILDISKSLDNLYHPDHTNGFVLVVDDDQFNRKLVKSMLKKANLRTLSAKNGREAVEIFVKSNCRINVILMDCEMDVMNGWIATRKILEYCAEKATECPLIYGLTAHDSLEVQKKCLECGMIEMLKKPVSYVELIRRVKG